MIRIGIIVSLFIFCLQPLSSYGQGFAFGVKGGLTAGMQQGNSIIRDVLLKYHGVAFIESAPADNNSALYAQLGYHVKGGATRNIFGRSFFDNQIFRAADREFQFRTLALGLGAKQKKDFGSASKLYYQFGVHLGYTVSTNLDIHEAYNLRYNTLFFPINAFVQPWNYGISVGGGLEFPLGELVSGLVELSVSPDISRQYIQPRVNNITDPFTGQARSFPERQARNIVLELSVGIRFLRKVIYID